MTTLNEKGQEILSSEPVAIPLKWKRKGSTLDELRHNLHLLRMEASLNDHDTPEEADDFDVDDDPELKSRYEIDHRDSLYAVASTPLGSGTPDSAVPTSPTGNNPPVPGAPVPPSSSPSPSPAPVPPSS